MDQSPWDGCWCQASTRDLGLKMCQEELMEADGNLWGQFFQIFKNWESMKQYPLIRIYIYIYIEVFLSTHFFVYVWYATKITVRYHYILAGNRRKSPSFPTPGSFDVVKGNRSAWRDGGNLGDGWTMRLWGTFLFKLSKWEKHEKTCTTQDLQGGVGIVSFRKKNFSGMIFNFSVFARQSCFVVLMKKGLRRRTRLGLFLGDCV